MRAELGHAPADAVTLLCMLHWFYSPPLFLSPSPLLLPSFLPLSTETQCSPLTSTVWLGTWHGLPSPLQFLQLSLQMARSMCLTSTSTNMNHSVRSQVREGSTLCSNLLSIKWSLRVVCGSGDFIPELSKKYHLCKSLGLSTRIKSPLHQLLL